MCLLHLSFGLPQSGVTSTPKSKKATNEVDSDYGDPDETVINKKDKPKVIKISSMVLR